MAGTLGRFLWWELITPDPDAAVRFYTDVIGWRTEKLERGCMPYTAWISDERAVGGVVELHEKARAAGAAPQWLAYIGTDDVDATVEKAAKLGASVFGGPADVDGIGRFAVLVDPHGGIFALLAPAGDAPAAIRAQQPGGIAWNELITTDVGAAYDFYEALFGWAKGESMDMGELGPYQLLGERDSEFGGIGQLPPEHPRSPFWLGYITVGDMETAVERVKKGGGQVAHGPMEVPGGDLVAQCTDPQGVPFALHAAATKI
jgi:uncharacterized protein